jgi:hypothetical protein
VGAYERTRDDAAYTHPARHQLVRNLTEAIELWDRNHLLVRRDLKHAVRRGIDNGITGPQVLRPQLRDDGRARGSFVAEGAPADASLELGDDWRGKSVREDRKRMVEYEAHQLPVPGDRVLSSRALRHPAESSRGWMGLRRTDGRCNSSQPEPP